MQIGNDHAKVIALTVLCAAETCGMWSAERMKSNALEMNFF